MDKGMNVATRLGDAERPQESCVDGPLGEGFRTPAVSERGAATGRRPEASQERTCGWGARAIGEGLWGFGRCDATAWTSARTI